MDALVAVSILIAAVFIVGGALVLLIGRSATFDIILGSIVLVAVAVVLSIMAIYDFILWLRETARLNPVED